jgi:hypothetical protein
MALDVSLPSLPRYVRAEFSATSRLKPCPGQDVWHSSMRPSPAAVQRS